MTASTFKAVVHEVRNDTSSVYTLFVKPEQPIVYEPGQFFFIFTDKAGRPSAKAYSAANSPGQEFIEFCIKRVDGGYMSNKLYHLKRGDLLTIGGPYGFFTLQPIERDVFFIATGTGVSALRSMIHDILNKGTEKTISLIFGVRTQQDLLYREEWEALSEQHSNFLFIPVLSREEWERDKGYVQDVLDRYWHGEDVDFYLCGLYPMVDSLQKKLLGKGIRKERIHLERYT